MDEKNIRSWLTAFKEDAIDEDEFLERLKYLPFQDLDFAKIDHHRSLRTGFPEVIYGEGKDSEQILAIAEKMAQRSNPVLITRLNDEKFTALNSAYPGARANYRARTFTIPVEGESEVIKERSTLGLVISAGTSDMPVAEEAVETLKAFNFPCNNLYDVGVAGLHRLLAHKDLIFKADVIAVVAGMEGALASVIGGLVEAPVIAVPTSVGYGANFGGVSALLGMLTGCAGGVAVVNIDNGFAAGYMMAVILRNLEERSEGTKTGSKSKFPNT